MRAGTLDRSIKLWRYQQVGVSGHNEPIIDWDLIRTLRAAVKPLGADERFGADQVFATRTTTFTTRWFPGLQTTDVIGFDGEFYDITGIAETGRRVGYEITATWRAGSLSGVDEG